MRTRPCPRPRQSPELAALTCQLRKKARKVTGPRLAILQTLQEHGGPMSSKEIFTELSTELCNLATVYRSLHLLEEMGVVKRFDFGDGVARYELLSAGDDGHHHHLVCTNCRKVVEVNECAIAEIEQELASANGFKKVTHHLEFFGLCPSCQ